MPRGKPWPPEKRQALVERVQAGETLGAAAKAEGVPKVTAQGWVAAAGVERSNTKKRQTEAATEARLRQIEESRDRRATALSAVAELGLKETIDRLRDEVERRKNKQAPTIPTRDLIGAWTRANHDLALVTGHATSNQEVHVVFNVPRKYAQPPPVLTEDELAQVGP